jgi:teichoic acid transport system permease protein
VTNRGRLSAPGGLAKPGSLSGPGGLSGQPDNGGKPAGAGPAGPGATGPGPAGAGPGGPGRSDTAVLAAEPSELYLAGADIPAGERLSDYAKQHNLEPASARPPALKYLRMLWQRRQFITGFATASNVAMYSEARLGQLWQVLTPLLNAGVYFLIFGVLLGINRGVPDYIPFLVTGIFVFNFTQRACITSSTVMRQNLPLIRALPFPRGCLPLGYVVIELQQLLLSFAVLFVIILGYGEPPTWYWLLIFPILALQTLFNVGCAFILARWGSGFDDVSQLLPFIVRTWFYASGVIFSIQTTLALTPGKVLSNHPTLAYLLQVNPAAVYITLIRNSLLTGQRTSMPGYHAYNAVRCAMYGDPAKFHITSQEFAHKVIYYSSYCHPIVSQADLWWYAAGWAVVAAVIGYFFFWWAEMRYGRG